MRSNLLPSRVKRLEDPKLLSGAGKFVDDLTLPKMLHLDLFRSQYASAKIKSIDLSSVRKETNVVGVFTGTDMNRTCGPLPYSLAPSVRKSPTHYAMATGVVRYVGEPITAVLSEDLYSAKDAVEKVEIDFKPLSAVVDPDLATQTGSALVHSGFPRNIACHYRREFGDVKEAFKNASIIVEEKLRNQRVTAAPMEGRGVLASYERSTGKLKVWSSTQSPFRIKSYLAEVLNLPPTHLEVIVPEVGGGFGAKLNTYGEEAITCFASMRSGRPVKWIEDRQESFQATTHGRDQIHKIELAADRKGRILGLRDHIRADIGAYNLWGTQIIPTLTARMLPGCYRIRNFHVDLDCIFTNKTPTDAYRGAGRPEATYAMERMIDLLAKELKIDPMELRLKNFVSSREFPYNSSAGYTYDSGNYEKTLKLALKFVDYPRFRKRQNDLWRSGRYVGIGVTSYVEVCGYGPSLFESAGVRIDETGRVTVTTGTSPHGQGHETTFAQLCAAELGVPLGAVTVLHGDTSTVHYGRGTFGSRSLAVGGGALYLALQKIKYKMNKIAAQLLETSPRNVVFRNGKWFKRGHNKKSLGVQAIAKAAYDSSRIPHGLEPGLEETSYFDPPNYTFPFGTHVAIAEVDVETGLITLHRYICVDDVGNVVNPMIVEGQIHGGVVQGIGQALYEEIVYNKDGQPLTSSFMDYSIPTACGLPSFELKRTVTPTTSNPLGTKGVGEVGSIGATAAIVSAVEDALSPFMIKITEMPITPEKVRKLLRGID